MANNNFNATLLSPNRLSLHNNEDSFKYKLECQSKIDPENPETKEWLEIQSKLNHFGDVKLFTGILEQKKTIIVKIGTDKLLTKEYDIGKIIDILHLPTFINFICIFSCNDNIKSIDSKLNNNNNTNRKYLCRKTGDKLTIIIMPYIKLGLLYIFKWNRDNFYILKNMLKHIIMSLCYARFKIGFIHKDLHIGNVLIKHTTRKNIDYKEFGHLETFNYIPIIIDYDRSIIKQSNDFDEPDIYNDFFRIISGLCQDVNTVFDIPQFNTLNSKYKSQKLPITNEICTNLCKEIDKFEIRYVKTERT